MSERTSCCFEDVITFPNEAIEKYLVCSVCYGLPRSVVMNFQCGHILCHDCSKKLHKVSNNTNCPVCRAETTWRYYGTYDELDIIHRRLYLEFTEVKCGNACGYFGPVPRVAKHEREECPNRYILCRFQDCPFLGPAHFIEHKHKDECQFAVQVCNLCITPQLVYGFHNCLDESILERKRMCCSCITFFYKIN